MNVVGTDATRSPSAQIWKVGISICPNMERWNFHLSERGKMEFLSEPMCVTIDCGETVPLQRARS